jgi:hypothetical protein
MSKSEVKKDSGQVLKKNHKLPKSKLRGCFLGLTSQILPLLPLKLLQLKKEKLLQLKFARVKLCLKLRFICAESLRIKFSGKYFLLFCALILTIAAAFYTIKTFGQTTSTLPDCSTITGTAQPGSNCLFYGLPLCQTVPSATYSIDATNSNYVLASGTIAVHRVNCADLADLALCTDIDVLTSALEGKNCVKECSDASFSDPDSSHIPAYVRGVDYAVHNRDCIRFSDSPESTVTASSTNSVGRKCHQVASGVTPEAGVNCDSLPCNLLTTDELNDSKFSANTSNKYCNGDTDINGDTLKCYKFTQAQLPYLIVNTMCKIHDCPPSPATCGTDDTLNITGQGTDYEADYIKYINSNYPLSSGVCNPVICKPIVERPYRCSPVADDNPTTPNSLCDTTGSGAACVNGYCYQSIDCNLSANSSEAECITSSTGEDGSVGSTIDSMNSWFYRPKPMSKAISGSGILRGMNSDLCYSKSQMESYGWGSDPSITINTIFGSFTIPLGYYHSYLSPDETRSPGMCSLNSDGSRGTGYIYLCGNSGQLYSQISDYTAYHKGYAQTTFSDTDATHKVVVCLRFKNAMRPYDIANSDSETCGKRECGISCAFGICKSQVCGYDVCRELTLTDSSPQDCMMNNDLFTNNNNSKACASVIDSYLRLRAVKYSNNRICTFLDVKGQLAYQTNASNPLPFLDSAQKLSDGTCISGQNDSDNNCSGGKSSYDDAGLATRWRAMALGSSPNIPYIQNNRPDSDGVRGYLDLDGKLFAEQECIKTPLRIAPSSLYNLANIINSVKLFTPPLYILNSMVTRGGIISTPDSNQTYGNTDFNYPEIEVQFGTTTQKLSLGIGYTGYETSGSDSQGIATITTTVSSIEYQVEVFVRKDYDSSGTQPTFCLYRKLKDSDGTYLNPLKLECVDRNFPEIDNSAARLLDSTLAPKKAVIYADAGNSFNNSSIIMRYLGSFGSNNTDNNCGVDDECSPIIELSNSDVSSPTCSSTVESYQVCAQRDECSQLNDECMQNEIDLQAAKVAGQTTDSFLAVRTNCNEVLLPLCNTKKGITADSSATITNTNPTDAAANSNAYGWFNEICISSGFETRLKEVVAYKMSNGTKGRCLTTDTSCTAGKAPDCPCTEYVSGVSFDDTIYEVRTQTAHEAGLCVDMPLPQMCAAIDYNTTTNTVNPSDTEFLITSLNQTAYGASLTDINDVVHLSYKARSDAVSHAEFPLAIFGTNDIEGECNGFWKAAVNAAGVTNLPQSNCLNVNGAAQWDSVTNSCVRYSCSAISTTGPDSSGNYQGNYGALETAEVTYQTDFTGTKGYSNGFATWLEYTKTNDFLEDAGSSFNSCITGFRPDGSSATTSGTQVASSGSGGPFFGPIQNYSGGTAADRSCNQLGQWGSVTNSCVRIQCAAVNPPTSPVTSSDWTEWYNSGGATFPLTNASRSTLRIQSESVATGTCDNSLGFFKVGQVSNNTSSGTSPTRNCDYLGNWGPVINSCTTQCDAITSPDSSSGFAYWDQVSDVPLNGEIDGVLTTTSGNNGCLAGYYSYPYPPLKNKDGTAFTISSSGSYRTDSGTNSTLTTIANNLANDTRAAGYPQRVCRSVTVVDGTANVWSQTSSNCTNTCPGSDVDSRIGAGVTQHIISNGGNYTTISVNWTTTSFGSWAYFTNPGGSGGTPILTQQNASNYFSGRTNGYYVLARYCNPTTHQWDSAAPQCAANNGSIVDTANATNANYDTTLHTVAIGASPTTSACLSGYYQGNKNTSAISNYTCEYKDNHYAIDEVYFTAASPQTGLPCQRYCLASAGQSFSSSTSYSGGSDYVAPDSSITLACKSGYGKAIDGGSTGSYDSSCGRDAYDRISTAPSIACDSNGSWSSSVTNDCSACRSCTYSSSMVNSSATVTGQSSGQENCGNETWTVNFQSDLMSGCYSKSSSMFNVSHDTCVGLNFTKTWSCHKCSGGCTQHSNLNCDVNIRCVDGEWVTPSTDGVWSGSECSAMNCDSGGAYTNCI